MGPDPREGSLGPARTVAPLREALGDVRLRKDCTMGRKPSPHGRSRSCLNAMRHGVLVDGVLKSRGPDRCPFRNSCVALRDEQLAKACVPGRECPVERAIHDAYIEDARRSFSFCRRWLSEPQFNETIAELAVVTLQRQRLSALIARDGFTRPKIHPVSGIAYGIQETLAAGRYATTLDNRFTELTGRLISQNALADV